jgi:two-component SAPR family response regulator
MEGGKVPRVWVVDDCEIDLFLQKRLMELTHFASDITTFKSPAVALSELEAATPAKWPDLLFLDLNMPAINGFKFLEQMAAWRLLSSEDHCRVLMISSSTNIQDVRLARKFPFVIDFISKPLTQQMLQDLQKTFTSVS